MVITLCGRAAGVDTFKITTPRFEDAASADLQQSQKHRGSFERTKIKNQWFQVN
jgi:hypothetical protein